MDPFQPDLRLGSAAPRSAGPVAPSGPAPDPDLEAELEASCIICLSYLDDRTVLPVCRHAQFCFTCLLSWAQIKRKCPLCNAAIGEYVIHDIHADDDYQKYFLRPPAGEAPILSADSATGVSSASSSRRSSLPPSRTSATGGSRPCTPTAGSARPAAPPREALRAEAEFSRIDAEVARRRYVYRHRLYAKHVGTNRHTRFRASLRPQDFQVELHSSAAGSGPSSSFSASASAGAAGRSARAREVQAESAKEALTRAATFVRRELRVWPK